MARLNVSDKWWTDPRRDALSKLIGNECTADGAALKLWRVAQEYWKDDQQGIPVELFEFLPFSEHFVRCSLVVVRGRSVFVRGCSDAFRWLVKQKESASIAGKKSAAMRKEKHGSAQPRSRNLSLPSNDSERSYSSSYSLSKSLKEESKGSDLPSTRQKRLAKGGGDPDIPKFIATYVKTFQERYGGDARPVLNGKVIGQIQNFLKETKIERACNLIEVYLQLQTPWFITKGHDFTTFMENLNPIGIALDTGQEQQTSKINWNKIEQDLNI